jgi:small subunit ribosomal protein S16
MLTIRLQRRGRKNEPVFRVIVVDSKEPTKTGKQLEIVGSYDPRVDRVELNAERIKHWIANGAQTSDTVHNLLISNKIIEGKKINVLPRKSPPKKEEEAGSATAAVAAPVVATADAPAEGKTEAAAEASTSEAAADAGSDAGAAGGDGASA